MHKTVAGPANVLDHTVWGFVIILENYTELSTLTTSTMRYTSRKVSGRATAPENVVAVLVLSSLISRDYASSTTLTNQYV
jgi:hypothetical protein